MLSRRLLVALGATLLIAISPGVAASTAAASSKPAAHAARHHKKKRHKKHKKRHHRHHSSAPSPTTTPAPTTAPGSAPTSSTPPPPAAPTFPLGVYTCWQTGPSGDPTPGADPYYSSVVTTLTFNSNGTYDKSGSPVLGNWHQSGSTIVFTSGILWQSGNFDQGTIYPSGTTMPNAQAPAPASGYTLTIEDTQQEGGDPPSVEFSTTDGPNGSFSEPTSFFYCKQ